MNYYNLYVKLQTGPYSISKLPEDDLLKIVEAFDYGRFNVFVNGEEKILGGLQEIKVYTFNDSWDTWHDFVNSAFARNYHEHNRVTGKIAIGKTALASKGEDLTKKFFNNDFGWKKKPEADNILMLKKHYINPERIEQLKGLKSQEFDFKKLVRICEEINIAYNLDCFYAVGNLLRSVLDHIAPTLGYKTFKEVANNYAGKKSFKEAMQHLENSLRKISDLFLHTAIQKAEVLPTENQVEFIASIDLLLAEIIQQTSGKA